MGLKKGQTNNPNGRPKGSKNKANEAIRDKIQCLFEGNFDKIQTDIEKLDPKDRLKFLTDLMPYLVPKLQSTTYTNEIDWENIPEDKLDQLLNRYSDDKDS
ncbi:DUF5681 domain-containing protein [Cecembia rubra]|uniref:DUF5681 domain-containing protein n=1 Tax=Cecembia rubra TaxID=1485585 RepID=A0A2P8DXG6_9BACT|nr:DUF5681 domain-containing protein [Cecembia rubra]PSL01921.1 hypothetical protein CLV48_1119 [Cecembia rubra]